MISSSVVLTAAHCVVFKDDGTTKPADDTRNKIFVGAYEKNDRGKFDVPLFGINRILPHPSYDPTESPKFNFDFALLFLDGQVTTTQPVQLDLDGISDGFQGKST